MAMPIIVIRHALHQASSLWAYEWPNPYLWDNKNIPQINQTRQRIYIEAANDEQIQSGNKGFNDLFLGVGYVFVLLSSQTHKFEKLLYSLCLT